MRKMLCPAFDLAPFSAIKWRSLNSLIREPQRFWPREILEQALVRQDVGKSTIAMIADPDAFKAVLKDRAAHFPRAEAHERPLRLAFGRNLTTASGPEWRRQRRALSPVFSAKNLAEMAPRMQRAALSLVGELRHGSVGRTVRVVEAATRVSLDVMWRTLVDPEDAPQTDPLISRMSDLLTARQAGLMASAEALGQLSNRLLELDPPRRGPLNLLSVLKKGPGQGEWLAPEELQGNALLFMQGGHDTTAAAIAWGIWLLGSHEDIQNRAYEEIESVVGDTSVGADHAERLTFLNRIVHETLRLYPPVPLLVKAAREPLQVGHDVVEAGSIVILNFYGLQRHARWWRAPDRFDPDRFAANSGEPAHQYVFVPFNSGPRVCIGASFAMLELIIVLATLLQHLRFSAIPDTARAPELRISLRPHSDMTVQVRER